MIQGALAIVTVAGAIDREKVKDALYKGTFKSPAGDIVFDEKGDIKNGALTLYTYKGGERAQLAVVR